MQFNCYVDESGDEGFNFGKGSSPWFIISGIVVRKDLDRSLGNSVHEFVNNFYVSRKNNPPKDLHWMNISYYPRLSYVQHISKKDYRQVVVAIWKEGLNRARFINQPANLYRYGFKMLVERMSRYVQSQNGFMKITVSESKSVNMNKLTGYIAQELEKDDGIRAVFDPHSIKVSTMNKTIMLRVADACTSAFGNAFNPDGKGICHSEYAAHLIPSLYRSKRGELLRYGLKIFPDNGNLANLYPFINDWLNT